MLEKRPFLIDQYRACRCYELAGAGLRFLPNEGGIRAIRFADRETLEAQIGDETLRAPYTAAKAAEDAFFVHTELPSSGCRRGLSFVYDARTGLATFIAARQGHLPQAPRSVAHQVVFCSTGRAPGSHAFTDGFTGHEVEYRYSADFAVKHRYLGPHRFIWEITVEENYPENIGIPHEEFCDIVLIRPDLALFSWLEAQSGTQGAFALDLDRLRTTGAFFGCGPDGAPESYPMGAFARILK